MNTTKKIALFKKLLNIVGMAKDDIKNHYYLYSETEIHFFNDVIRAPNYLFYEYIVYGNFSRLHTYLIEFRKRIKKFCMLAALRRNATITSGESLRSMWSIFSSMCVTFFPEWFLSPTVPFPKRRACLSKVCTTTFFSGKIQVLTFLPGRRHWHAKDVSAWRHMTASP